MFFLTGHTLWAFGLDFSKTVISISEKDFFLAPQYLFSKEKERM